MTPVTPGGAPRQQLNVRRTTACLLLVLTVAPALTAQAPRRDTVAIVAPVALVIPGEQYRAGWLHRLVLGADYRSLWTTPIVVDMLDLRQEAGGLTPTRKGGSMQTTSLRFTGADKREYVFRPSEKDFTRGIPPELRETLVRDIAQDQVSGYHPGAAIVTAALLDATSIRHPRPRLVVMPDDPSLGEFRREFAGVLGTFEERPSRNFDASATTRGATAVISSERLFERMLKNASTRVDTRAYLEARLFDILVGDRDRHRDQWRWGRFSSAPDAPWQPVPRDRDMPFARFEGLGPWMVRGFTPQMVTFSSAYPQMVWLNWSAREIDRRLLVGLERATWDSAARGLQRALTDSVLRDAIARLPEPWVKVDGDVLYQALVARREALPRAALEYYEVLAREVNLRGTNDPDRVNVTRHADGSVDIAFASVESSGAVISAPWLRRTFRPGETHEVRLYLDKGADRVVITGAPDDRVLLRVVGGPGDDVLDDQVPGGDRALLLYDDRVDGAAGHGVDRRRYAAPSTARVEKEVRDWGSWSFIQRGISAAPGVGALASISHTRIGYAFRHDPYSSRSTFKLDVSLSERRPRLTWDGDFTRPNSQATLGVRALASGIELIRWHGIGNETSADGDPDAYRVFQNLYRVEPRWTRPLARGITVSASASAQYTDTRDAAGTIVGTRSPYGSEEFGQVGGRLGLVVDRRDSPNFPSRGFRMAASSALTPALWDVKNSFGDVEGTVSTYVTAPVAFRPTLALRAGGRHVWGDFPFHEAAQLGGVGTLRGWDVQRFAGRSMAHGSAELRAGLGKVRIIAPSEIGILAFQDVGRVFADDESSNTWHVGRGAGLWVAPLVRNYTVSVSVARGKERTGVYLASGFAF